MVPVTESSKFLESGQKTSKKTNKQGKTKPNQNQNHPPPHNPTVVLLRISQTVAVQYYWLVKNISAWSLYKKENKSKYLEKPPKKTSRLRQ